MNDRRFGPTRGQVNEVRKAAEADRLGHPSALRGAIEDATTLAYHEGRRLALVEALRRLRETPRAELSFEAWLERYSR